MDYDSDEDMRDLPIGRDDFIFIRENDGYYVDKTRLIPEILGRRLTQTYLFTRPRRFGKSLNMSMLNAFFNMKYKGNGWFEGLEVDKHRDLDVHKNAYPVVKIDFNSLPCYEYGIFQAGFSLLVSRVLQNFSYLEKSEKLQGNKSLKAFERLMSRESDDTEVQEGIRILCELLTEHHGVKPIILIDEYDKPINSTFDREHHGKILDYLRGFYSATLKGNENMTLAVLTGVMQVAKESIFSGLNNLYVNNVLSEDFDECFGYTDKELKELLEHYERPDKYEECKEWYDGYRFGNAEVYNPWSVNNYVKSRFKPDVYWGNTSSNDIIMTLMDFAGQDTYEELTALGNGGTVLKDLRPAIPTRDLLKRKDSVYSIMVMAGYLNARPEEDGYALSIPNKEVYKVFYDAMMYHMETPVSVQFRMLFRGLENGDVKKVEDNAFSILAENFKAVQLKDEGDYQLIIAGAAMGMLGRYTVSVEMEAGNGRADMIMRKNRPEYPNIVVEFKRSVSDDPDDWKKEAEEGLEQIKRKGYHRGLEGKTLLYGVCFRNKKAKAVIETVSRRRGIIWRRTVVNPRCRDR